MAFLEGLLLLLLLLLVLLLLEVLFDPEDEEEVLLVEVDDGILFCFLRFYPLGLEVQSLVRV